VVRGLSGRDVQLIARKPFLGRNLDSWLQKQARDMTRAVRGELSVGLLEGQQGSSLAERIVRRETQGAAAWNRARANLRVLVESHMTEIQVRVTREVAAKNPSMTQRYLYMSMRDNRVTTICRALDGRTFSYQDPHAKFPPQHTGCRSHILPLTGGSTQVAHGVRSYHEWLKDQARSTQDEALGAGRAELWRTGKVTLADMVSADDRTLTLKQLHALIATVEN
jgi:SPP1 gp7 family putative phage head morphogenesis protein